MPGNMPIGVTMATSTADTQQDAFPVVGDRAIVVGGKSRGSNMTFHALTRNLFVEIHQICRVARAVTPGVGGGIPGDGQLVEPVLVPIQISLTLPASDNDIESFGFIEAAIEESSLKKGALFLFHHDFHAIVVDITVAAIAEAALYRIGIGRRGAEVVSGMEVGLDNGPMAGYAGMSVISGYGRPGLSFRYGPLGVDQKNRCRQG